MAEPHGSETSSEDETLALMKKGVSSCSNIFPSSVVEPDDTCNRPPPTLFHEDSTSALRNTPFVFRCCLKSSRQSCTDPPTYSTICRPGRFVDRNHLPVLIEDLNKDDGSCSFVARTPPPSYVQSRGIRAPYSLEQLISFADRDGRIWTPRPTFAICPRCATLVVTVVRVKSSTMTHITAFVLFMFMCWPCCIFPYILDSCKTSHHYCPYCRTYLGTYTP